MTQTQVLVALLVPLAYILGSLPFGLMIGLARGVDPRRAGSGNIGATNVGRLLGGRFFALCFGLDLCKSLLPMLGAGWIIHRSPDAGASQTLTYFLWLMVGFAAIVGHMFSVFLKFKGGKGVATSAGVVLGLYPFYTIPGMLGLLVWLGVFLIWRYVSLASIVAAISFAILYAVVGKVLRWPIFSEQLPLLIFAILVAVLVVARHRSNIQRLRAGTEHAFRKGM
jgi:acyl phosphate:glycerol-3-phosphate acyltransferase